MKVISIKRSFIILTILLIVDCALGGYIGVWREGYWSSVEHRELGKWLVLIAEFIVVALISCKVSGYSQYIASMASLSLRTTLTRRALKLGTYTDVEGGPQRVQADCGDYPRLLVGLICNFIRSGIMIVIFAVIIINALPWYYLFIPVIYSIVGTLLASKIALPLISLNYLNQVVEAKFRQILTKINYAQVHRNNYRLFVRTKYLTYFQTFYGQITVIIPHLALSFLYFGGKITFGVFMQIASSMAEITNSLSVIITSLNDINNLLSCRRRLKEIGVI